MCSILTAAKNFISFLRAKRRYLTLRVLYYFGYNTLAARAILVKNNKILLIKHSYIPEWHMVGGSIDKGETPVQALKRELLEELNIECLQEPKIFGVYYNNNKNGNDYKMIYVVEKWRQSKQIASHSSEILESRMFDPKKLPEDISPPTLRRMQEYIGVRKQDGRW